MTGPTWVQDLSPEQMRQLLVLLQRKRRASREAGMGIRPRHAGESPLPLSFAQERLWFLDQLGVGEATYNVPWAIRLTGRLDAEALRRALEEVVRRHEALRTTFGQEQGIPFQAVAPAARLEMPGIDLAALAGPTAGGELRRLVREEARRPFDLAHGPVLRTALLRLGEEEHVLLLALHHIVSDGWSMGVLVREIAALYAAFVAGGPSPLPELPVQYADYALWQHEHFRDEALAADLTWWRERLTGLPESLDLPADRPRPRIQSFCGDRVLLALGPGSTAALSALATQTRATLFMVLLAGFEALLARVTGQSDLAVGTPVANRNRSELAELIGMFVNTLALRVDAGGDPTFIELLARVRREAVAAFDHQELPFEKVVEAVQPERDLGRSPIFQVMLVLQSAPMPPLALPGLELEVLPVESGAAKLDLMATFSEQRGRLGGELEYSTDLFEAATAARLGGHLATLLSGAAAEPGARLSDLPLLTEEETCQVLGEWSTVEPLPPLAGIAGGLHRLFELQAARTPGAEALAAGEERLTYAQLDARASRLAGRLRALGVAPESPVALLMERSADLVAALLAVLKAGGAYVPLDPAYPEERIALVLEDTGAEIVLTQEALAGRIAASRHAPKHVLALGPDDFAGVEGEPGAAVDPDHLAYVIYTSGSTGRPKGVAIRHGSVVTRLAWAVRAFRPEDLAGVLASTSICFDLSVFELFAPLSCGGRVVLAANALELPRLAAAGEVTLVNTVPSVLAELVRAREVPASVRIVNLAGEPLPRTLADAVHGLGTVRELFNLYGPSEDTTYSTWTRVGPTGAGAPSIGRPLPGTRAYLLDQALCPQPAGVPGELCLGGDGLARGYLNRPEITAGRFVPDPFSGQPGQRLYRTGDLARWRPDGEIEFLGRIDHQVKVRGFRIEPGEVEAALLRAGAREAAVAALGAGGDRFLAAWVAGGPAPATLRAALREALPEPMVPTVFVELEALPRTPNGKVDRRALPAPGRESPAAAFVPPCTPEEELLAGIWAGVLGLSRIGAHDDFFALGGHSLLATRVVSRVREAFQIELPVRALFERPTVASLAAAVETARRAGSARRMPPLQPVLRAGDAPLSFAQERLWFLDQLEPGSPAYNMPFALRLEGELQAGALAAALTAVTERHEVLRTTFLPGESGPVQRIAPHGSWPLVLVDLGGLPEARRLAELSWLAGEEELRPFDLGRGPLVRGTLVRLAVGQHAALLTLHHAVCDGWSLGLLVREVAALYAALAEGRPSPLPPLPVQYADFAVWQRGWLQGEALESRLRYWRERLAGAPPVLELPADRPRPAVAGVRGGLCRLELDATLVAGLQAFGRWQGTTLFMTLLAAFKILLCRSTGQEDLLVGTPVANRNRAEIEDLIGFFVNTLVLRDDLSGDPSFRELAGRVRGEALAAYAHQDLPFERLVEELAPERSLAYTPLFQVMVVLQNTPAGELALPGLTLAPLDTAGGERSAKHDLTLFVAPAGEALEAAFVFRRDLFDLPTVERLLGHFASLLKAAVADPESPIGELPLLSEPESAQLLLEWNDTGAPQAGLCLHEIFAAQAQRTPAAVAVEIEEETLTYRELAERAGRLADHLRALGVGPDVLAGICLDRSFDLVTALVATLAAGGAYLPLDPEYPRERLALLLADARPAVVLTRSDLRPLFGELPSGAPCVLCVDEEGLPVAASPVSGAQPANLACLLYTSGSTGRPKGVMATHAGLVNRLLWAQRVYPLGPQDRVLQSASFSFDFALWEIFAPWLAGARVVLARPGGHRDSAYLVDLIASRGITVAHFIPSMLRVLLEEEGVERCGSLRLVLSGGEPLSPELREQFFRRLDAELRNQYGPTEASIDVSHWLCHPGAGSGAVPIGRPVANTRILLLDRGLRPVPAGVAGELCIGGVALARGYLGRPDLTAERFVPDPWNPGERLYRTGDLARHRSDGAVEFLGRLDHQVKIRGFRIEPGEIEAVLESLAGVRAAVVEVRGEGVSRRLVAYVVPQEPRTDLSLTGLRAALQSFLPEFMVPAAWVLLPELPLTPNGKLDRRALPEPEAPAGWETPDAAPCTPAEELIAGIWADLLDAPRVGIHDDFFGLGGHSLLATRVVSRIRAACRVELPLRILFEVPTVAGLAAAVEAAVREGEIAVPPILPRPQSEEAPLSFAQQRLWFLAQLESESAAYNVPAAVRLTGTLDRAALAAALGGIVARHEALRTSFPAVAGEPVQKVAPAGGSFELPLIDVCALPEPAAEARRLVAEEALRPFDVTRGPLLRGALLRLEAAEHIALLSMHHIVSDAWSSGVLVRELAALYAACRAGRPSPLPPLLVQYADFAVWQRGWMQGEALESLLAFWRERLAGAPGVLELPADHPRPAAPTGRGGLRAARIDGGLSSALAGLGRREGLTLFMTLLAAWDALLFRLSGQMDLVVGSPIANRNRVETEGLIGFFTNTLALRARLAPDMGFRELAQQVREEALQAFSHQDLPFERLVEELSPERSLTYTPLFQVLFTLQNAPAGELALPGLTLVPLEPAGRTAKFDLSLFLAESGGGLSAMLEYAADLFDATTAGRILERFRTVLEEAVADPARSLADLPLLPAAERQQVLAEWNDVAAWDGSPCVHRLVEVQARRTPEATAVLAADGTELSYGDLDQRADRLARRLLALGVRPDDRVGVCLERSWEGVAALLAVLKAGGCYLPLDPAYPQERLAFMLADAAAPVIVTRDRLAAALPPHGAHVLSLNGGWPEEESRGDLPTVGPDHLSYVIYTSGSTGRPKGVALPHRTLANLIAWQIHASAAPAGRTLQFASPSFDVSVQEVFATWAAGGTLVLVPEEVRSDAEALLHHLREARVDRLFLPFVALQQLAEAAVGEDGELFLREVVTAGEQLQITPEVRTLFSRLPGCVLRNQYGPSETHVVTEASLWAGELGEWPALPPIGRPIAATAVHLLDPRGMPAPIGVPGEVHLGGAGLARGYLGRPELTAERFVPDPWGRGDRLYRTGDLARRRPDGEIEFLGRIDHQVKIRGFRVELGEIEAALATHPSVREAVVVARGQGAAKRLVACILPADGIGELRDVLRAHLRERLPDYMVPSAFVAVERFPLTPSGKVDRRALAASGQEPQETAGMAPRTPVEEVLASIFAEVLGLASVSVRDGFFDLGGHSLLATRVVSRIRTACGIEMPLRALFETPSVEGLAPAVETALRSGMAPAPPIVPAGRDGDLPLSFAQERLWFLEELVPGTAAYTIPFFLRLTGPLDGPLLEASFREVVRRHEALRTTFPRRHGQPVQSVTSWAGPHLPVIDLAGLAAALCQDEAARLAQEEEARPFDLEQGPLLRTALLRHGGQEHDLHVTLHHIVADGWSLGVLGREVSALYGALAMGSPSPLPPLPVQYPDYAVWQRAYLAGEALETQLGWWREHLAEAPVVLELPIDRPRPPVQSFRGATEPFELPEELTRGLRSLARAEGATLFMVLLAGFAALLHRVSGQDDVVVGSPVASRGRQEIEELVGLFLNTLPLRTRLDGEPTFRELIGRVRETALGGYAHQEAPFEKVVEALVPGRDLSRSPLFQVMLVLQDRGEDLRLQGIEAAPLLLHGGTAKLDLLLGLRETGPDLAGVAEWSTDLFDASTVRHLLGHLRTLLEAAVAGPAGRISELALLSADERRQILVEWNATAVPFPRGLGLHELFAAQAARTPEATALVWGSERLSYRELDLRSGRLARKLLRLGVGPEVLVGVCSDRTPALVTALLAVLKAGGAYLPLDPAYPRERLAFLLVDSGATVLLTREHLLSVLPPYRGEVVLLDGVEESDTLELPLRDPDPEQLAYLIYTSGSTGLPKGVAIRHASAVALVAWAAEAYEPEELSGVLGATSICFDLSVFEIFVPLATGGTVILADNVLALAGLPAAGEVTLVNTVPSAMAELVRTGALPSSVRTVNLAGEPLARDLANRIYELPWVRSLHDLYGPSEDTTYSTGALVPRRADAPSTIGRPLANTRVYLLDARLQPTPVRVPGELCIGGAGLARGYLNRPEITAGRFVPDPFSGEPGGRLYRTGDLARYRREGEIEFLGRIDHQVKVRGFRIEPGEVEAALLRAGAREAAVAALGTGGDRFLAAWVAGGPAPATLRAALREALPEPMVPTVFVELEALPRTPNGKVDRRALPAPGRESPTAAFVPPCTPEEELLAGIWAGVLGLSRIGAHDDFFALGGHSLLATRVVSRVCEAFQIELPVRVLFEAPTVAGLALAIEEATRAGALAAPPIVPVPRTADLPLSFAQQRLWFLSRLEPESAAYNIPVAVRLTGSLDRAALAVALGRIMARHEALRTTFPTMTGSPVQRIAPAGGPMELPLVDLGALPRPEDEARRLAAEEALRPFRLEHGPLLRGTLLRLGAQEHAALLSMHHIVSDGWSSGVLIRELGALYPAMSAGGAEQPALLPELPVQYADFAVWQRGWLQGEALESRLRYWRERLAGAPPVLELPADRPRPAVAGVRGGLCRLELDAILVAGLQAFGRRQGTTLFMTLLAAFKILLCRSTGQEDLLVGTPVANRNRAEIEDLIGFFVNTLVLRGDLSGGPSFRELAGRVRGEALAAYAHQDLPFERLVEELAPERSLAYTPLFQVMVVLQNTPAGELALPGLTLAPLDTAGGERSAKHDLTLFVAPAGEALEAAFVFRRDLFDLPTVERLLGHFASLLKAAVADPESPIGELPLLSEPESAQLLLEWNDTGAPQAGLCLHEIFAAQAQRTPAAVAVEVEEETLTYRELADRAGRLADHLRALGVGPDVLAGICLERSFDLVTALVATLAAGGAYLPLDPEYPRERLALLLADARPAVVLTRSDLRPLFGELPSGAPCVLCVDEEGLPVAASPVSGAQPANLACLLYTSGSTGRPKGVMATHAGLVNRLLWAQRVYPLGRQDRVLQSASFSFDFALWEIFAPWLAGARVVLARSGGHRDSAYLVDLIASRGITVAHFIPSMLRVLLEEEGVERCGSLRLVLSGGEPLSAELRERFFRRLGAELRNQYGPTEASIDVSHWLCRPGEGSGVVPIGRPVDNTRILLLDRGWRPVPAGVAGELCIGGVALARGYLGRPDLTAERFVPDPWNPGERLYRTGDLARHRSDGAVEFLGRLDHQVKIRGFRIEPGEIEAVLESLAGVRAAVVEVRGEGPSRRLVAYVVPQEPRTDLSLTGLRAALQGLLPEFMVPAAWVLLPELPLTPNGKLDRRALPEPEAPASPETTDAVPRTPVEELIAGIWADLLGYPRVGIHDDFFDLGGHSLLATRVVSRIRAACRVELPLRTLFEAPTVVGLAAAVEAAVREGEIAVPPILPRPQSGEAPLSFAQQRLWFLAQLESESAAYNVPAAVRLTGALDRAALAAALGGIVARHEALRTSFPTVAGEPVQQVAPAGGSFELPLVDLGALPEPVPEARRLAAEEALRPFDVTRGPLLRGALLRLEAAEHIALLSMHHIVSDAWSSGVLIRELAALYAACREGRPSPLPPLPVQYADFAVWQRSWMQDEALESLLAFWRERLVGAPAVLELPADRPRPAVPSGRGGLRTARIDGGLSSALAELGRREGLTLFMTLLAAWDTLLFRLSGQMDLVVGSPIANRNRIETEGLIGFFTNTLALRVRLAPDMGFRELAQQVREEALQAFSHQDLPFERLVEELSPERSLTYTPLFQVLFTLQNAPAGELALPGLTLVPLEPAGRTAKFDLSLFLAEMGDGLFSTLEFAADLFDATTASRILERFRTVLEGVAADPDRSLAELPLLPAAERQQILAEWNDVAVWDGSPCVHHLVEAQARRTPEAIAVLAADGTELSYGDLDRRAGRLARRLLALGVRPDGRVGVCLERSWEGVAALLAVLKAGGCYLPLDPAYPQERLAFLLADTAAPVIITCDRLAAALPPHGAHVLSLDGGWPEEESGGEDLPTVGADHLSYVIYTSGSTGRPKGVALPHRTLANLIAWQIEASAAPAGRTLQFASPSFDVSVQEVFATWAAGGTLVLVPEEVRTDAEALLHRLREARVERLFLPFVALQQLAEAAVGEDGKLSLREVVTAGEQLQITPEVRALFSRLPGCMLRNQYGPSETHVVTESSLRPGGVEQWPALPPIGRPIAAIAVHLLDPRGLLAPIGVPGEVHLGGAGLARGYLGRPDLTAERFVPDPWGQGDRLYRTGDLARRRTDGEIEFLGRIDHQVKIRGFRVELGEIEAALATHPAVREAVVVARGQGAAKRLVACILPTEGVQELRDALRAHLRERLPDYMVPSAFVAVERFPLTPSGKVDRRALASSGPEPQEAAAAGTAPRTPVEEVLAGIFAEVLGLSSVSVRDGFFDLGGHSLLATRVVSRMRVAFDIELPLRALFETPAVEGLAGMVEVALRSGVAPAPPVVPVGRDGDLPLSFAQQRLWFLDQMEPGSPAYNLPIAMRLSGRLDPAALAASLAEVMARHEVLRTRFEQAGGEPVQRILPAGGWDLPLADLAGLPEGAREAEAHRLAVAEAVQPFDLARGPLLRGVLLRLEAGEHVALLTLHHIASDGWSMDLLVRELAGLYPAFAAGRPSPLPPLPVQYGDFAVWQRSWLQGETLEAQLAFWRQRLAGAPPALELPTDRPRPAVRSGRGAVLAFRLSGELTGALAALSRQQGATLFMVLLAALETLLFRITGQDDPVVGAPIANRNRAEIEGLIGFFVNTLALRGRLVPRGSFQDLVARTREETLGAYAHQDLPFERLVEELAPQRDLGRTPLFQVMLVLQNAPSGVLELPGLTLAPLPVEASTAKHDLTLALAEGGAGLTGALEYDRDLFDRTTAERLVGWLETLLAGVAADPGLFLAELPLLSIAERRELLEDWSRTATAYPREAALQELFEAQADLAPDAVAVVFGAEAVTYRELDRRANRLAHRLRALGVGPEGLVTLLAERSLGLIVALLGALKAGGAYAPLDPAFPPERLALLLEDLGAPVVLAQDPLAERLPAGARVVRLAEACAGGSEERLSVPVAAEALAYVMYTSGSTGRPNGVAVVHRAVVRLVRETGYACFGPGEVWAQLAPMAFDASTLEVWGALLHGGRLAVLPPGALSLGELRHALAMHEVTSLWLTAGLFHQMAEEGLTGLDAVRQLLAGGDVLSPEHVRRALASLPGCRLINGYGPTENTTFTCCHTMSRPEEVVSPVPLGQPIANTRVWLLDAELNPVPVGVAGELYTGGDGLARGYLNRPVLTAERFVPDLHGGEPGGRLYRTRDLARWRTDGTVEFLGRLDQQVKLRGFRVEPGEVEAALAAHPAVRAAAVMVQGTGADRRLVAFVVGEADRAELRRHLEPRLPAWMVPSAFVALAALPLTPNGKVDRRALAALETVEERAADLAVPRTPMEELLAGMWAELLGLQAVGRDDDFFALGGHSLLATQLVSRLRSLLGAEMPLRTLFEHPTLGGLAAWLEGASGDAVPGDPVLPVTRDRDLPLSFAQERLWFLDQLEPGSAAYNIPFALRLTGALNREALAACFDEVVARHETLRTTFGFVGREPVQRIAPHGSRRLPWIDLTGLPKARQEREARLLTDEEARSPFDLSRGPLVRSALLRLADEEHLLLLTMHHIVCDGWSNGILVREMAALYAAFAAGRPSHLPSLQVQYADFAAWQRDWMRGAALEAQISYWRERLEGAPHLLELPVDRERPAVQSFRGGCETFTFSRELTAALERLIRREGVTMFMALLAGFKGLLHLRSEVTDVVIGTNVANRSRPEIEPLIGFFVNMLVLRTDLSGDPTFRELLARVREVALGAYSHQDLPFERLVQILRPERSLSRQPLFQVVFSLQNASAGEAVDFAGLELRSSAIERNSAKYDLVVNMWHAEGRLAGSMEYSRDLFEAESVRRLSQQFERLLESAVAAPDTRLRSLNILSQRERELLEVEVRVEDLAEEFSF